MHCADSLASEILLSFTYLPNSMAQVRNIKLSTVSKTSAFVADNGSTFIDKHMSRKLPNDDSSILLQTMKERHGRHEEQLL